MTPAPTRDPRVDPMPGDRLRGPRGGYRWVEAVVVGVTRPDPIVVYLGAYGIPYAADIRDWRRWGRGATVVGP